MTHPLPNAGQFRTPSFPAPVEGNQYYDFQPGQGPQDLSNLLSQGVTIHHKNALTSCLASHLGYLGNLCYQTIARVTVNLLSSGVALAVQYFGSQFEPRISASAAGGLAAALSVGKFVGLVFLLKNALAPFVDEVLEATEKKSMSGQSPMKTKIQDYAIRYLTPMALAVIIAYKKGIPVDAAKGTLYTIGIFGLMKLLDKSYGAALQWYSSRSSSDSSSHTQPSSGSSSRTQPSSGSSSRTRPDSSSRTRQPYSSSTD
jgi:hypothetical protein